MKRPPARLLVLLIGTLAFSLVGSTSYALYRTAMGPEQCCKSHCGHCKSHCGRKITREAAERCCRTHLTVLPAAVGNAESSKQLSAPPHVTCHTLPPVVVQTVPSPGLSTAAGERGPPNPSLVAQHTSLLI